MSVTRPSPVRDWPLLGLIWVAVTAANLYKPYHIDDSAHLFFAQAFMAHPLQPMTTTLNLLGVVEPIWHANQPPLYFYLIGLWGLLFGTSEPAMHALGALFSLAAIVLFYRIARVMTTAAALWLTAIMMLGPAFVVSQNLMVDVPLLALWLLFFDALITGADKPDDRQTARFVVAGLAAGAALLVKYSSLVLPPVLILVLLMERRWRLWWTAAIPFAFLGFWAVFNLLEYRHIHMLQRPAHPFRHSLLDPVQRFVGVVVTLGGLTPFGLLVAARLVPALRRRSGALFLAVGALFLVLILLALAGVAEAPADTVLRVFFLLNGIALVAGAVAAVAWRVSRSTALFVATPANVRLAVLVLWVLGHFAFYSLYAPFMAARHVLLVLPALLLLGAMLWPLGVPRRDGRIVLAATIALTGMVQWADWRFAGFIRDEAAVVMQTLPPGSHVWTSGVWSWQWYAARAGMQVVDMDHPAARSGDYFAMPYDGESPRTVVMSALGTLPPTTLVRTDHKPLGIGDLFCTARPTHFYGVPFAWLPQGPWMLTGNCMNLVEVYQVK